jgi:hypothetical protein
MRSVEKLALHQIQVDGKELLMPCEDGDMGAMVLEVLGIEEKAASKSGGTSIQI